MKIYLDNAVRDNKIKNLVNDINATVQYDDNLIQNGMQISKEEQQRIFGLFYNDIMVIFKEYGITDDTYQIRRFVGVIDGMPKYEVVGIKTYLRDFYNELYGRITRNLNVNNVKSKCYDLQYEATYCIGKHEV